MGLSCGKIVLSVAVLAILITAPLGALGMDASYKKLLARRDKLEVMISTALPYDKSSGNT